VPQLKLDDAEFESAEEESKRVLDDSLCRRTAKKVIREYQPDAVKLKTISSSSKAITLAAKTPLDPKKIEPKKKCFSCNCTVRASLSQTAEWKEQDLKSGTTVEDYFHLII
jgi:hypothetical protein